MLVLIIVSFMTIVYYINFRRHRKPLYELSNSLPDIERFPIIGHGHWFIGTPEQIFKNVMMLTNRIDKTGGVGKLWIGSTLYIVSLKPEDVQKILETCLKKDTSYKFLQAWLGNGLFVAPVELWKSHRRQVLPIFNNHIVEDFVPVFGEQASFLCERLEHQCGTEFDVYPFVSECMLDIVFDCDLQIEYYQETTRIKKGFSTKRFTTSRGIYNDVKSSKVCRMSIFTQGVSETAMGERMDVQREPNTPYLRARHTVISIINMRVFKAWLRPNLLFNITPYATIQKEGIELTHKFTDEVISRKKKEILKNGSNTNQEGRKDLLGLLMEKDNRFTDEQLREHIDSITIAGNDTTSLAISYALLLLGNYPEHQEKLYQEVLNVCGDSSRVPTREDLNKMEYLERVIKETMRLYMVVPIIGRETERKLQLSTCTVPAGVGLAVIPYALHRNKRLWGPDVEEFNPDRFLPENSVNRHPCAFIPFSHGTRNCIGRHFGMLAMKMILSAIVRKFKIKAQPEALNRLKIEVLLFPVDGHRITIEKRVSS